MAKVFSFKTNFRDLQKIPTLLKFGTEHAILSLYLLSSFSLSSESEPTNMWLTYLFFASFWLDVDVPIWRLGGVHVSVTGSYSRECGLCYYIKLNVQTAYVKTLHTHFNKRKTEKDTAVKLY